MHATDRQSADKEIREKTLVGILCTVWRDWWGGRLVDTLLYNERRLGCVSWLIRESGGYKRLSVSL